jgi:twinkle protein
MANYISDQIDFSSYMQETDAQHRVLKASSYTDEVIRHFRNPVSKTGVCMPWRKTQEDFRFRRGEVTLWSGMNGHGKSQLLGQILIGFMTQKQRIVIASMEMKPQVTLARMTRQASQLRTPDDDFITEFLSITDNWLWLYDQLGAVHWEKMLAVIRYSTEKLNCQHFVIDSLMKCGIAEDDYTKQKHFLDQLCAIARDTDCHIHLIAHSRKGKDELDPPNKMDVKGSGSITDQVDNVYTCWRNKKKELDMEQGAMSMAKDPDCLLICDKQRNGEREGRIKLWFDRESYQYTETDYNAPIDLLNDRMYA